MEYKPHLNIRIAAPHKIKVNMEGEKPLVSRTGPTSIWLNSSQLMDKILRALNNREPCSIVSVGATEAFAMAQYTIYSEEEIISDPEAQVANRGVKSGHEHRGISFPNLAVRDDAVEAVKKANIVGYNTLVGPAQELAEKVMAVYDIKPPFLFEANLRRVLMFSQQKKFEEMLRGRRVLLISSLAPRVRNLLERPYKEALNCDLVGALSIYDYEEIPAVKRQIEKYDFELCLLAAGVNALILAPYIAETFGKVAFDIGWGMESMVSKEIFVDTWIATIIGVDTLLRM